MPSGEVGSGGIGRWLEGEEGRSRGISYPLLVERLAGSKAPPGPQLPWRALVPDVAAPACLSVLCFPDWTLIHLDYSHFLPPPDCVTLTYESSGPARRCCIRVVPQAPLCPTSIPHPFLPLCFHLTLLCPLLPLFPRSIQSLPFKVPLRYSSCMKSTLTVPAQPVPVLVNSSSTRFAPASRHVHPFAQRL